MHLRWVLAFLTTAGCVHASFTGPARGGPSWTHVSSEHFTVTTDFAADEATKTCAELETMLEALSELAFGARQPPRMRFEVVSQWDRQKPAVGKPRELRDGEVHALWARLRKWNTLGSRKGVLADIDAAKRGDADPVEVALVQAFWAKQEGDADPAEKLLRGLVNQTDDRRVLNALGWLTLERFARQPNLDVQALVGSMDRLGRGSRESPRRRPNSICSDATTR